MTTPATVGARVFCVAGAVLAAVLALSAASALSMTGFPDGHLTDYDKAVDVPKHGLMWVEIGFVVVFLVLALLPIGARARTIAGVGVLVALVSVAAIHWLGVPWYFGTHLRLDNGIGG